MRHKSFGTILDENASVYFLKFDKVTWTIDERLGVGVLPLYPVQRTWMLNEATQAKIKRKGFLLVPDYAWTAFMSQGMNLSAGLADCGDVLDVPTMADEMNIYVVLSRFSKAEGLLLLRAFSRDLFQSGEAPGPYCLLKFLRAQFNDARSKPRYTREDARKEYEERMLAYTVNRENNKQCGSKWLCFECEKMFVAEGFDARHTDADSIYTKCVAPGAWRRCVACSNGRRKQIEPSVTPAKQHFCATCERARDECFFEEDQVMKCSACVLADQLNAETCGKCSKMYKQADLRLDEASGLLILFVVKYTHEICIGYYTTQHVRKRSIDKNKPKIYGGRGREKKHACCKAAGIVLCWKCGPHLFNFRCTVCDKTRSALEFRDRIAVLRTEEKSIRRCLECCVCDLCGKDCTLDLRLMECNSKLCRTCYKEEVVKLRCNVCKVLQSQSNFPAKIHEHVGRNEHLRCQARRILYNISTSNNTFKGSNMCRSWETKTVIFSSSLKMLKTK